MSGAELSHLFIHVPDAGAARWFYSELLGLDFSVGAKGYIRVSGGDAFHLGMEQVTDLVQRDEPELVIRVADVDAMYETLLDAGFVFDGPPEDMPWGNRQAWTRDPNGLRIAIYTRVAGSDE
jgi:catechol 2,3-dioxygenase-like lactoylglutathione lyase family enzyme